MIPIRPCSNWRGRAADVGQDDGRVGLRFGSAIFVEDLDEDLFRDCLFAVLETL